MTSIERNVTIAGSTPPAQGEKFYVTASTDIETPFRVIKRGSYVLIDPATPPGEGRMVLIDGKLVPWSGQEKVDGVALMISVEFT